MRGRTAEVQEPAETLVVLSDGDQGAVTARNEHVKLFGADALAEGGDELMGLVPGTGKAKAAADGP
jgi:hypothetical protein